MADRTRAVRPPVRPAQVGPRAPLAVRLTAVFAGAVLVWLAVLHGVGAFFDQDPRVDRVGHAVRAICTAVLAGSLVVLARRFLDRRPWAELRLTGPRAGLPWLLRGMLFWLVAASLGLALTLGLGWADVEVQGWGPGTLLLAVYLPVLVFLFEALPAELVFRGYLYRNLADRYGRGFAVVGQAVLFTVFGVLVGAAPSADRVVLLATFALVLGILRAVSGNLWAPIGFHLLFQTVAQLDRAAAGQGVLLVRGRADLELVTYWLFPVVLGGVVLTGWWWLRRHRLPPG